MASKCSMEEFVKAHGGERVIKKVLIANNGMAATKAIMSMRQWAFLELGSADELEFVAMASKDDLQANAEFIRLANSYVEVPPGKNTNNYANVDLIVEIAKKQGVHAVWPGWGHASEKPELPRALAEAGIAFLGPTAPVMHALGDKIASTILAQSAKVPVIPWNGDGIFATIQSDGSIPLEPFKQACLQNCDEAIASAKKIGYPVVLKASEGGGGKGIRKANNDEELRVGWEQVITEVAGSPIFMMQLAVGARHLEVQLMGDEHGDVIALSGRDCSTQRRFQKIFEEGPPSIASREDFREAEKAAQRLAQSVGYRGAGTVEYLYKPATKSFFFLELNPRLQVEHPVTEGITGVNVPALQLLVGMGLPLSRVPDIRRFYGLQPHESSKIDFLETDYIYPTHHVMAARITAENPDDSFRPTSGRVERVRFQSSPSTWGYFSIGSNGAVHDFADSQFGHIFAKGATREEARKALQLALQNVLVVGEIRTPVEYLVELAETKEFRENTIDTAWLDKLISEKALKAKFNVLDAVFYAACFRAHAHVRKKTASVLDALQRGHLPLTSDLRQLQAFDIEVGYDATKYTWYVKRTSPDSLALTIGAATFEVRFREQPDGSLYVIAEGRTTQISGVEETLGLRLRIEGTATIMFPKLRDPSELRSDYNGKIVRYLQDDGAEVNEGDPFIELEAMKMVMPLRATASGKIHHTLSRDAVVVAGQLLASLVLKDASTAQTVKPFSGVYTLSAGKDSAPADPKQTRAMSSVVEMSLDDVSSVLTSFLNGFALSPSLGVHSTTCTATQVVQRLFPQDGDASATETQKQRILEICGGLLGVFLKNEQFFAGLVGGDETQIKAKFPHADDQLLEQLIAHDALKSSLEVVASILRSLTSSVEIDTAVGSFPEALREGLKALAEFPTEGGYGELRLLSWMILQGSQTRSMTERKQEVRQMLASMSREDCAAEAEKTFSAVPAKSVQTSTQRTSLTRRLSDGVDVGIDLPYVGMDILTFFFNDPEPTVRKNAVELYIRRSFRGFEISKFNIIESKDVVDGTPGVSLHALWTFSYPGVPSSSQQGYTLVLPNVAAYESLKSSWVLPTAPSLKEVLVLVADAPRPELGDPKMHEESLRNLIASSESFVTSSTAKLESRNCQQLQILLCAEGKLTYLHYSKSAAWKEIKEYRNLRSALPWCLELPALAEQFTLSPIAQTRRTGIFQGSAKGSKTQTILVGTVSPAILALDSFELIVKREISQALDMIERANLDPDVGQKKSMARVFVHFVSAIPGSTDRDLKLLLALFDSAMRSLVTAKSSTMQKLRLERVMLKVWVSGDKIPLKMIASNDTQWEGNGFRETIDEHTGFAKEWLDIETQERTSNLALLTPLGEKLHGKRSIARAAGSTYIYDFVGLFRIALTQVWLQTNDAESLPEKVFSAVELVLNDDGELVETDRDVGQNTVGTVVFQCEFRTPGHPDGRKMIVIGNDVTIKAGSFGTFEDDVFQKASQLARESGLPRIHISCNSGARLGTVEELKTIVKVAWVDENDPNRGFEHLYLESEDLDKLPVDSVRSHPVTVQGKTRHVLDTILGLNLPSTKGGIGVENLQGSGLIAGETSRAYEETFTLSYVTGRSVGIGAYLNRLGQRVIQMVKGPMILTGYQALNKLLGQQVYTTQDQLGGPHIMVPNGVTHELVRNDSDGVDAILRWLSFIPADNASIPAMVPTLDSIEREVTFMPSKTPYDPRHMLAGTVDGSTWLTGFCDKGSFHEYMAGWGKTVVVGRGTLGGMPIGIVAVETRAVERQIPADPADPTSHNISEAQAGQVWYPDSAFKTAQAIRDFNRGENLPLVIFANWRGFSGGTRDMFAEVLKYGAMIVDALVDYKHPVTIYIPPHGELRGGAWVVLDPKINPDHMEMFADVEARGGILEPPAASEIVFKGGQLAEMMHRNDPTLMRLDTEKAAGKDVGAEIKSRETMLLPFYRQVATHYCDLHDRSGRMKKLGAIHEELEWRTSRSYLHWRIRRRQQEGQACQELRRKVPELSHMEASQAIAGMVTSAVGEATDQVVAQWLEANRSQLEKFTEEQRQKAAETEIFGLFSSLSRAKQEEISRDLIGFSRVANKSKQ